MKNDLEERKLKAKSIDIIHTIAKAGISAIPVVGGPAAELFAALIVPPLSKRRDKWIVEIAEGLKKLEERVEGFKIENLSQNEMFVTTVMHASQVAIRNHQKEKLEALRNAVLNAALPNAPEEDMQLLFLNFVDNLTSWHLRILKFFDDPLQWAEVHGIKFNSYNPDKGRLLILECAFLDLREKREFAQQLVKDLGSKGLLIPFFSLGGPIMEENLFISCTSDLGKEFINFITSPFKDCAT